MTCDIVIRTWKPDLVWLQYALRFLKKNWADDCTRIFIIANSDCREDCRYWETNAEFIYVDPWPDTHEFKCYCSLLSENLGEAELIVNLDSDMMLVERSALADFLHDGRPIINYRPHSDLAGYVGIFLYSPILEYWFETVPSRSYMILPPFVFWRSTIRGMRELIERKSGKSLRDALYSEHPFHWHRYLEHPKKFPDWEMLGFYCDLYERDRYHFHDPACVHYNDPAHDLRGRIKPYHSWSQWSLLTIAELDRLLAI